MAEQPESTTQYQQYREDGGSYRDQPAPNSFVERTSNVIHGGANKVKGLNQRYRLIERTNNALQSAGQSLKRWDEKYGFATRFNNAMDRTSQRVNQWDENHKYRERASQAAANKLGNLSQRLDKQNNSNVEMGYVQSGYVPPSAEEKKPMPQALT